MYRGLKEVNKVYKEKLVEIFNKIKEDNRIENDEKKSIYTDLVMDINSFIRYINTVIQIEEKLQKMFMGSDEGVRAYKTTAANLDAKRGVLHERVKSSLVTMNGYCRKYDLPKFCEVGLLADKDAIANIAAQIVAELNKLRCDYSKVTLDSLDKQSAFYEVSLEDFLEFR